MNTPPRLLRLSLVSAYLLLGCSHSTDPPGNDDPPVYTPDTPSPVDFTPAWSPDGSAIAYTHCPQSPDELRNGTYQIWLYAIGTHENRFVTRGIGPSWSPDGNRLAYCRDYDIWVVDLGRDSTWQLTFFGENPDWLPGGRSVVPQWSPTDSLILFVHNTGLDPTGTVWIIRPDGTGRSDLRLPASTASWSHDGAAVVFNTLSERSILSATLADPLNSISTVIPPDPTGSGGAFYRYPFQDRLGRLLAYARFGGDGSLRGLWVAGADGVGARLLVGNAFQASWSPTGEYLVYEHKDWTRLTITLWVVQVATGQCEPLEQFAQ